VDEKGDLEVLKGNPIAAKEEESLTCGGKNWPRGELKVLRVGSYPFASPSWKEKKRSDG